MEGALPIAQDATLYGATIPAGATLTHSLAGRQAYLVAARGTYLVNGVEVEARDGVTVEAEDTVTIEAVTETELLLADLPPGPPPR